jgi:hypothetical protein
MRKIYFNNSEKQKIQISSLQQLPYRIQTVKLTVGIVEYICYIN